VARRLFALALSWVKTHSLLRVSRDGDSGGVRILPVESDAHAFVLGLIRPILFVTEGLATGAEKQHLGAVIAHERAHIRRRDPLRRFIAGIGLALHLPGVARWIEMQLSRTQEIAADREAARAVGAARVARALVALAKSKLRVPRTAIAFAATSIEDRVRLVMDARTRSDWPSLATVIAAAAVLVVMVVAGADGVHHGVEMMLGAFGD
jgi:Zn-dependent protease with chaperone function